MERQNPALVRERLDIAAAMYDAEAQRLDTLLRSINTESWHTYQKMLDKVKAMRRALPVAGYGGLAFETYPMLYEEARWSHPFSGQVMKGIRKFNNFRCAQTSQEADKAVTEMERACPGILVGVVFDYGSTSTPVLALGRGVTHQDLALTHSLDGAYRMLTGFAVVRTRLIGGPQAAIVINNHEQIPPFWAQRDANGQAIITLETHVYSEGQVATSKDIRFQMLSDRDGHPLLKQLPEAG